MAAAIASLDGLPPELFNTIIEIVSATKSPLAPLAAASRACQWQVEQVTFKSLTCSHRDLPNLDNILDTRRFSALRTLTYDITDLLDDDDLSDSDEEKRTVRVTPEETSDHDEAFTAGFCNLLSLLKQKGQESSSHPGLSLCLAGAWFCTDPYLAPLPGIDWLDESHLKRAWVRLIESNIPSGLTAEVVTHFQCHEYIDFRTAKIWPASWIALLARFPSIKDAMITPFDNERKSFSCRKQARDAFGIALKSLPSRLETLELAYDQCVPPENQFLSPPSLISTKNDYDILSHELGCLSNRLIKLDVRGATLSLEDFFKVVQEPSPLQYLYFHQLQAASPNGEWYFTSDPRVSMSAFLAEHGDGGEPTLDQLREKVRSEDMDEDELPAAIDLGGAAFRAAMDPDFFISLYCAVAQAMKQMKNLREFGIEFHLYVDSQFVSGEHVFEFYRGSKPPSWRSISSSEMVAALGTAPEKDEVDESVQKMWRGVATDADSTIDLLIGSCDLRGQNLRLLTAK